MLVVGARPNFVKMAPIVRALEAEGRLEPWLVHTGQHYDANMSAVFFEELELPRPRVNLEVGSATHGTQTGVLHLLATRTTASTWTRKRGNATLRRSITSTERLATRTILAATTTTTPTK